MIQVTVFRILNEIHTPLKAKELATIFPKKALFSVLDELSQLNKEVSIVFGSPLTIPDYSGGAGVPGVGEIIKKIETVISERGKKDEYIEYTSGTTGAGKYQKSFEFINGWLDQSISNKIIEDAIIDGCGLEGDEIKSYPESLDEFSNFVRSRRVNIKSIITTNFDPLIETSFKRNGIDFDSYTLSGDGSLPKPVMSSNEKMTIYHIHGFWRGDDTLHTDEQLTSERNKLSASLENVIGESVVLVMAYGGWDDIFINAIKKSLSFQKIKANIIWCFFDSNPANASANNLAILEKLSNGLNGNKVRFYCDINCKLFFKELNNHFEEKYNFPTIIDRDAISDANSTVTNNILKADYLSTSTYIENDVKLKRSYLENRIHHNSIRSAERNLATTTLIKEKVVSLNAILGGDKNGFLGSVVYGSSILKHLPIYRVDLFSIESSDALHVQFKKEVGVNIAPFISIHSKDEGCLLILDNISTVDSVGWRTAINEVVNTIKLNSQLIYLFLVGDASLETLTFPCVKIGALDNPELYSYLTSHPNTRSEFLESDNFHKISELTQYLPEKVDSLLHNLRLETLDDYLESVEEIDIFNGLNPLHGFDEILPKSVQELIYEYSVSDKKENYDCYVILKALAILEYGETFKNIKSYYSDYNLSQKSFHRLIDIGLITLRHRVITLKRELRPAGKIIMTINPLVSSFIKKQIDENEVKKLVQQGLELSLGVNWKSGKIRINTSVKEQILESHSYGPGNVHSLLCIFMKYAIREQNTRDLKSVFNAALAYIDFLYGKGRFNDVVISSQEIYQICAEFDQVIDPYKLIIRKAEGLRITGRFEEAEKELLKAINEQDKLSNEEKISCFIEMAYIKEHEENKDATMKFVQEIKVLTSKNTEHWFTAEGISAHFLPDELRAGKLSRLEKKARRLQHYHTADNLSLTLALEIKDLKQRNLVYDKVINSSNDEYTQIRALLRKTKSLIRLGQINEVDEKDRIKLKDIYVYLFTQRLEKMTDNCHDILWEIYSNEQNLISLLNLFRHSSIIWLLSGNVSRENKYLEDLSNKKDMFLSSEFSCIFEEVVFSKINK